MKIEFKNDALKSKYALITSGFILGGLLAVILDQIFNLKPVFIIGDIIGVLEMLGLAGALAFSVVILEFVNFLGLDRHKTMGIVLGLIISIGFIIMDYTKVLKSIEEFSIDARFRLSSFQIKSKDVQSGVIEYTKNPDAHPAIEIVGIDQKTVNAYQGFPFPWRYYADFMGAMEGSKVNTIMFDIFFMDPVKNDYGVLSLIDDVRARVLKSISKGYYESINVSANQISNASSTLSNQMSINNNVVMDYTFELSRLAEKDIDMSDYQKKIDILNRYEIINVLPSKYDNDQEWVNHPEPPIPAIGNVSKGIGYANIRKEQTGVNRSIPLVIKWKNKIYPSIDLILAARYYGVDFQKDIEVKLGEYVKIKNIPSVVRKIGVDPNVPEHDIMVKPNKERTITIPIDPEGFMGIKFIGGPWSFPSWSFVDLATSEKGEFGRNDPFANKILLVAIYYATGVAFDIHNSPFGAVAGIEHHANALNTILKQDFIHYANHPVNFMIYLIIGLILGFAAPRYNIKTVLLGTAVFAFLFTFEVFFAFNVLNYVHVYFTPYIQIVIILIAITGYKVLTEEENVKYIRSTFSKFVSKDIVNEMLANPEAIKLGGAKKEITVFFSDIRGFTTMSEALSPEDLVQLLNDYLSTMTELVIDYKGTVDKYMGDAIMAFWGAPLDLKDHAYYACVASLKQLEALKILQGKWATQGWPIIDIGIGLNTGYAVVGNMGSSHRMDYTVMGDTVNLGSRLEGTNKVYTTRIIISEYTYAHVKDRVIVRELDSIRVKGKKEPVTIFELVDIVNQSDYDKYRKIIE
ncbi:MAG: adenylate/guanylate cyclase domain-containing protein [Spirochaetia bacterium]|nr:adenylate/guanylate cyclase domain-containing protein [Spirochaetia bacterium]